MVVRCGPIRAPRPPEESDAKICAAVCARCAALAGVDPFVLDMEVDEVKEVVCHVADKMELKSVFKVGDVVPSWCEYVLEHLMADEELKVVPPAAPPEKPLPEDLWDKEPLKPVE